MDQVFVTGSDRDIFEADVNGKIFEGWRVVPGTLALSVSQGCCSSKSIIPLSVTRTCCTVVERYAVLMERQPRSS